MACFFPGCAETVRCSHTLQCEDGPWTLDEDEERSVGGQLGPTYVRADDMIRVEITYYVVLTGSTTNLVIVM